MNINKLQRKSIEKFLKQHINKNKTIDQTKQSIKQMIALLKQYEIQCQSKQDFQSAQQAKNKIEFLNNQSLMIIHNKFQQQDKQNMSLIAQTSQKQIKQFEEQWENHLKEVMEALQQSEVKLLQQHQLEIAQIQQTLKNQKIPKVKYSSTILTMKNHLQNLIKIRSYKQAEFVKNNLIKKEKQQQQKWLQMYKQKNQIKMQNVKKKQETQLKALRMKIENIFNEQVNIRNQQFEKLLKKNRKRIIQNNNKMSRARIKSRVDLLNQSRSFSILSKY